ncbi:DUF397 domain-containing protein [Nocardiopsis sp. NPDC049922]|uniref:DUF397 domain-containing protein n=1 Tax=Nocardiopsis sp. NPDC049922 TaxID=3155157 RepID=UPI00340C77A5
MFKFSFPPENLSPWGYRFVSYGRTSLKAHPPLVRHEGKKLMQAPPGTATFRKSSYSVDQRKIRQCVEVGEVGGESTRYLRDSVNPDHGAFALSAGELAALLRTATA